MQSYEICQGYFIKHSYCHVLDFKMMSLSIWYFFRISIASFSMSGYAFTKEIAALVAFFAST